MQLPRYSKQSCICLSAHVGCWSENEVSEGTTVLYPDQLYDDLHN